MPTLTLKQEHRSAERNTPSRPAALGNQTAERTLAVLDTVASAPARLGVREIARRLGLAPSVVQRLVNSLAAAGYLEQCADSLRYRIGYRAFLAGSAYLCGTELGLVAAQELQALTNTAHVNTYLGVLRERSVVYLLCLRSNSPLVINSVPGARAPVHSTAFGKALMAGLPQHIVREMLGDEPYEPLTRDTRLTLEDFLADVRAGQHQGYFVSDGENLPNVLAVGAPVRDATGDTVAAISAATPRSETSEAGFRTLCLAVRETAERISRRLGAPALPTARPASDHRPLS
ncbi:MAG: IclR family transcriptional regulator [Burkholderiaceae bacterium]|nr:IclR family transcriptional regulator [Burkholderiaceae bacterium]